jgi:hypothetical protein
MLWLFVLVTAWFVISAFGIALFGSFWAWMVLLLGLCVYVCNKSKVHQKTSCCFKACPNWWAILIALVGVWFILGAEGIVSTYGINLLYLVAFLIGIGFVAARR